VLLAIAAPHVAPYDPLGQDLANRLAPRSWRYWFGTDPLGRDIWSRTLYGARISVPVGVAAVGLAALLGTLIGALSGSMGKLVDEILMRIAELMLAFPSVILALAITAALGAGIGNALIAIANSLVASIRAHCAGLVLSVKERDYVQAAYAIGSSETQVMIRHVLPNIAPSVIVLATLDVGHAI
jgi:peptide/nickel transport system permease protein